MMGEFKDNRRLKFVGWMMVTHDTSQRMKRRNKRIGNANEITLIATQE